MVLKYRVKVASHIYCGGEFAVRYIPGAGLSLQCLKCGFYVPEWELYEMWRDLHPEGTTFDLVEVFIEIGVAKRRKLDIEISHDEIVSILKEAIKSVRKYKDGKRTKDTWLRNELIKLLKSRRWPNLYYAHRYYKNVIADSHKVPNDIINYAIDNGLLSVVKEVSYSIPYAYKKHTHFRGWKAHIGWRVLSIEGLG